MSKLKKLYEKIKNNPKSVSFDELDKVLRAAGFEKRRPRGGSSHHIYTKGSVQLSVPPLGSRTLSDCMWKEQ